MFSIPAVLAGASAFPVAVKAVGELHRITVLQSNTLARQGESVPEKRGEGEKIAKQRAAGISGGTKNADPAWLRKVPSNSVTGDLRDEYMVGGLGNATSSKGNIIDILDKVPRKTHGTEEYKRIARPQPKRAPGFGNQSFTP